VTKFLGGASVPKRMGSSSVPRPNGSATMIKRLRADLRRVGQAALLHEIRSMVREGYPGRGDVNPTAASSGQLALEGAYLSDQSSPATPPGGWFAEGNAELEAQWQAAADGWLHEDVKAQLDAEVAEVEKSLFVELAREVARARVTLGEVLHRNIAAKKRPRSASRPFMMLRVCLCVCLATAAIASFLGDGCPSDCVSFSAPHCAWI
jgi:hypothetical protein